MGRRNSVREMIIYLVHFKASVIGHSTEADGGQAVSDQLEVEETGARDRCI